ncbi:LuxR C-terminal-related transcriptional regulator [Rhodococcus yananensis]|uniref:LuxR C-terminal-related transcriptional regulator n=1 Tax=Rhodococcus yananensis TaxID=2879464 RepID=UPI001CF92498|nr:LuxR C-terminal-related transcriptional regulator [Rhodococcus yananensis]
MSDWITRDIATSDSTVPAWVRVSDRTNTAATFWVTVRTAIDYAVERSGTAGPVPVVPIHPDHPRALAADLARRPYPIILIIDDAHLLHDPIVLTELTAFIDTLAHFPHVTVVFLARGEPSLPWHEWAAAGIVSRIGWEQLALDEHQVRVVLAEHDSHLDDADVSALIALTDGWAALVRIAAIHLHTRTDRRGVIADLARSPHPISDQLIGDLLTALPQHLLDFLLSTCIVDAPTVELCEHLTDTSASDALEFLERSAFPLLHTVEPGTGTITRRYHPMLVAHLRAELHRTDPIREVQLHSLAARWYLSTGAPVDALAHLVAADDTVAALDLARHHGISVVLAGDTDTFFLHLDALGLSTIRTVRLLHALDALEQGSPSSARAFLDTLAPAGHSDNGRIDTRLEAAVDTAAALAEGKCASPASVNELSNRASTGCLCLDSYARTVHAAALLSTRPIAAATLLDEAAALANIAGDPRLQLRSTILSAWLHRSTGDLARMHACATAALKVAEQHDHLDSPDAQHAVMLIVLAHYLRAEPLDPTGIAGRYLATAGSAESGVLGPYVRFVFDLHALSASNVSPARVAAAVSNAAAVCTGPFGSTTTDLLPYLAGTLLSLGRRNEATHLHRHMVDTRGHTVDSTVLAAMIEYARGHHHATRQMLADLIDDESSTPLRSVRVHLLDALAAQRLHHSEAMRTSVHRALELAEPHGLARPFLDLAADCAELLTVLAHDIDSSYRFTGTLRRTLAGSTAPSVPAITAAEQVILVHLPSGRTAEEIGHELQVSVNTVKTHIRNLYRKFGVRTRGEAISAAIRCGLL